MIEFKVDAMSCGHCVSLITDTIKQVDPQARVEADLASKKVQVESSQDRGRIAQALTEVGYPPAE
jgi:copper chaperone